MEYVQGTTLRDRIGQLATPQAVELAYQICLGMEFINKRGETVHADLKPENILISRGNIAKIIDFGISKAYDFMSGVFPRQSTGTIPYKSPEQLNGEVLRQTSDIFSFGILFFEMLTGQFPYPFSLKELARSEQSKKLKEFFAKFPSYDDFRFSRWQRPGHSDISDDIWEIVVFSMNPNPFNRWRSFTKLRKVFESRLGSALINKQAISSVSCRDESPDLHKLALSLYKLGEMEEALDIFNQALAKHPDDAEMWRDAALALVKSGQHDLAKTFFLRAKGINPKIATITEPTKDF